MYYGNSTLYPMIYAHATTAITTAYGSEIELHIHRVCNNTSRG